MRQTHEEIIIQDIQSAKENCDRNRYIELHNSRGSFSGKLVNRVYIT